MNISRSLGPNLWWCTFNGGACSAVWRLEPGPVKNKNTTGETEGHRHTSSGLITPVQQSVERGWIIKVCNINFIIIVMHGNWEGARGVV